MDHPAISEPGTNICCNATTKLHQLAAYNMIHYKYQATKQEGPLHKRIYTVELQLSQEVYEAVGSSIRKAKESVAQVALERTEWSHPEVHHHKQSRKRPRGLPPVDDNALAEQLRFLNKDGAEPPQKQKIVSNEETVKPVSATEQSPAADDYLDKQFKTRITILNEYALKHRLHLMFNLLNSTGPPHRKTFTVECRVGDMKAQGKGQSIKAAKANAAYNLCGEYEKVGIHLVPRGVSALSSKKKQVRPKKQHLVNLLLDGKQEIGPVTKLNQMCQAKKEKLPIYTLKSMVGPAKKPTFITEVMTSSAMSLGRGSTKKVAKSNAAGSVLDLIQCLDKRQPDSSSQGVIISQDNEENVETPNE